MRSQTALEFLSDLTAGHTPPAVVHVFGPNAFLREYVMDAVVLALKTHGFERVSFHLSNSDDARPILEELSDSGLFTRRKVITCRIVRASRTGSESERARAGKTALETALGRTIPNLPPNVSLVILYERESLPANLSRAVQENGAAVVCPRPFANQIVRYAQLFGRRLGARLPNNVYVQLAEGCGDDLGAIYNAIEKISLQGEQAGQAEIVQHTSDDHAAAPQLFELARALSEAEPGVFCARLERALALGREPVEILAVEIIPTLRRMLVAASLLAARQAPSQIGQALGWPAHSQIVQSTVSGARRLGLERVRQLYREAIALDKDFKTGAVKQREAALFRLAFGLAA